MSSKFYLQRTVTGDDKSYSEAALLAASRHIVILAEPGGGKTDLMNSLANQLGCAVVTANVFGQVGAKAENSPLVIDAFDELAKIDKTGIHRLLGNVHNAHPTHVIVSSRSSEWDNAATSSFEDFLGHAPLVVRLREFDEAEQRSIFINHTPGEDFDAFRTEVARFDLEPLLPNPQFLKLFADAYVESGRHFTDKRSIFEQAVERLAKEANIKVAKGKHTLSSARKIKLASEVFAKLLLSGAEGIGTSEANESRMYPLIAALLEDEDAALVILATRLFKPGDNADQHRPVHKIVSEYCAADYLTKRIANPSDPLTISKCLPILAPNSTVRDELRGLLGWMASLGNTHVQEAAITLDPYAVLANGDPSQLEASSKRLLVGRLKDAADQDPYFRRGDFWRRFSVAGFFTQDVVDEIKPLLAQQDDGHLRDLILELLTGSPAIVKLIAELRLIVLSHEASENTRVLASRCLLEINRYDHQADLATLIFEASQTSLKVAAKIIETLGPNTFPDSYLAGYFRVCAKLYPGRKERLERTIGSRHFVKRFISCLSVETVEWLLNDLTKGLSCKCGKQSHQCDCRNGISKIVGSLLDRFFDLAKPPFDPRQVWQWVENLNFHERQSGDRSKTIKILQNDRSLRQGIYDFVLGHETNSDILRDLVVGKFGWHTGHAGLNFQPNDYRYISDLAFTLDNVALWSQFLATHQRYRDKGERGPDERRKHMRSQAHQKPAFLKAWAKSNRTAKKFERDNRISNFRHARRMKRRQTKDDEIRFANIKYVQDNLDLVKSGRHWTCLVRFADLTLMEPEKIKHEFGDETLVRTALRNCLDFVAPNVPDLSKLAELQCSSQGQQSETILYAACMEILRIDGHLNAVDRHLLAALKTNLDMHYDAVKDEEREALRSEVDRLLFPTTKEAETFCRQYIEPQLANSSCNHTQASWLKYDSIFIPLGPKLSIEWLCRYENMPLSAQEELFEIAAQHCNRGQLNELIAFRCSSLMFFWLPQTNAEELIAKRKFWFVRALYFLEHPQTPYWGWLKADRNTVLMLHERSGRMNRSDHPNWPNLTARKIADILDAFIGTWSKVPLPSSWGTSSPDEEKAYRFLSELIWSISSDEPDTALSVLDRLIADQRYVDMHKELKSIRAGQVRKKALRDFEPPSPQDIVGLLDDDEVITVGGLRQLVIQELQDLQHAIDGGEFNSGTMFYNEAKEVDKKTNKTVKRLKRKGENESTERIAERLNLRLEPQGFVITPEHQLKSAKRSDFTVAKMIAGKRRLLVTEVKGQWNNELYTAAAAQLHERYSIHPDAEQQGVYLVLWFGPDEKVAGLKNNKIKNAQALKECIEAQMPTELSTLVDVFVLDISATRLKDKRMSASTGSVATS